MAEEIERLVTVWDARFDKFEQKLNNVVRASYGAASKIEKRLSDTSTNLDRFFGKANPGKALDKVFDATRFKVLDTGAARVGLFGSALENLGPAGLAAAAGIGAVAVALSAAKDAIAFGDAISDAAAKVGVSTDTLQEYRYAIHQLGGEYTDADEALAGFTQTLGKAQLGFSAKAVKPFKALGLDPKELGDADHALQAVIDRLSRIQSESERQGLAAALGLDKFIPLLREGTAKLDELREAAHRLGFVMDAGLIAKAGEANDRFEDLAQIISVQLKSALVDLAPVLLGLMERMRDLAELAAQIAQAFTSLPDSFNRVEDRSTASLKNQIETLKTLRKGQSPAQFKGPVGAVLNPVLNAESRFLSGHFGAQIDAGIARMQAIVDARAAPAKATATGKPFAPLSVTNAKAGPRDDTAQRTDQVNAEIAAASRDLLQSMAALTGDIVQRAEIEKRIIDAEATEARAKLQKQIDDIADDKGLSAAKKAELTAQLEAVAAVQAQAVDAKKAKVDRDAAADIEQKLLDDRQAIARYYDDILSIESGLATTARERRDVELRILAHKQDEERAALKAKLAAEVAAGRTSQSQADAEIASQGDLFAAQRDQVIRSTESNPERFARENTDPAAIAERMQDAGVRAFEALSDGLADAIVNAHSLGDVAKNVFRQLIADLISQQLKSTTASLFAFIPGFASGTPYAPGGLALVGERGPELVNLPRGSQVIPNGVLKSLGSMQPLSAARSVTLVQPVSYDLRGAVVTDDLLRQMNAMARASEARAVSSAVAIANRAAPGRLRSYDLLGT